MSVTVSILALKWAILSREENRSHGKMLFYCHRDGRMAGRVVKIPTGEINPARAGPSLFVKSNCGVFANCPQMWILGSRQVVANVNNVALSTPNKHQD